MSIRRSKGTTLNVRIQRDFPALVDTVCIQRVRKGNELHIAGDNVGMGVGAAAFGHLHLWKIDIQLMAHCLLGSVVLVLFLVPNIAPVAACEEGGFLIVPCGTVNVFVNQAIVGTGLFIEPELKVGISAQIDAAFGTVGQLLPQGIPAAIRSEVILTLTGGSFGIPEALDEQRLGEDGVMGSVNVMQCSACIGSAVQCHIGEGQLNVGTGFPAHSANQTAGCIGSLGINSLRLRAALCLRPNPIHLHGDMASDVGNQQGSGICGTGTQCLVYLDSCKLDVPEIQGKGIVGIRTGDSAADQRAIGIARILIHVLSDIPLECQAIDIERYVPGAVLENAGVHQCVLGFPVGGLLVAGVRFCNLYLLVVKHDGDILNGIPGAGNGIVGIAGQVQGISRIRLGNFCRCLFVEVFRNIAKANSPGTQQNHFLRRVHISGDCACIINMVAVFPERIQIVVIPGIGIDVIIVRELPLIGVARAVGIDQPVAIIVLCDNGDNSHSGCSPGIAHQLIKILFVVI